MIYALFDNADQLNHLFSIYARLVAYDQCFFMRSTGSNQTKLIRTFARRTLFTLTYVFRILSVAFENLIVRYVISIVLEFLVNKNLSFFISVRIKTKLISRITV